MKPLSLQLVLLKAASWGAAVGCLAAAITAQERAPQVQPLQPEQPAVVAGTAADGQLNVSPTSAEIAELINQLGAASFADREAATAALLTIGEAALADLRNVSPAAAFEVRHRAGLIRQRIEADKFSALSRSFLLDPDGGNSYGLPAWHQYRDLVGASRSSKLLFLDMLRQQPELARLVEVLSSQSSSPAAMHSLESLAAIEAVRLREQMFAFHEPQLGDAVAMLLVAATVPQQTPVEVSEIIISHERRSFGGRINQPGYGDCLRKLLAAWLPKTHQSMAPMAMDCALRYDLSAGLPIARRHLAENFDSDTRKLAFYCLARFGSESDLPLLLPLMSDQNVVDEFARSAILGGGIHESNAAPPGIPREPALSNNMVVRINDLAFATALLLLTEDPTQFYPRFETHEQLGFFIHSLASPPESAEQQQQRIDQWKKQHLPRQVES